MKMFDLGKLDRKIRDVSKSLPGIHTDRSGNFEFKLCQPNFNLGAGSIPGGMVSGKCKNKEGKAVNAQAFYGKNA